MESEARQRYHKQWLFDQKLKIFDSQSNFCQLTHQGRSQKDQENHQSLRKNILTFKDIESIYQLLNKNLYDFRFGQEKKQKEPKSKGESNKKKNSKETEKQSYKIKKFMELFNIPENQEQEWKKVLKVKRVTKFLEKVYCLLFQIIQHDLQLFEKGIPQGQSGSLPQPIQNLSKDTKYGFVGFKNEFLSLQIKILISVLVMDILKLIDTVKIALFPYNSQELKKIPLEQQQQKKQFQQSFEKVEQPKQFILKYKQFGSLSSQLFLQSIKLMAKQVQQRSPEYSLWICLQSLKRSYLTYQKGILFKKHFQKSIQSTLVNELHLYWLFYSNKYRNSNLGKHDGQSHQISFYQVFSDYAQLFGYLVQEAAKDEKNMQQIVSFFYLIIGPWKQMDQYSALKIFWDFLLKATAKVNLPEKFISDNLEMIEQAISAKIDQVLEEQKSNLKKELSAFLNNLPKRLIELGQDQKLKEDYFQQNKGELYQILQRYQTKKQVIQECQKLLQTSKNENILTLINNISSELSFPPKRQSKITQYQNSNFDELLHSFDVDKGVVEEMKHFLFLANSTNLEICRKFYQQKRKQFSTEEQVTAQSLNRFGIIQSIKIATFELITTIKLEEGQQIQQNTVNNYNQAQMKQTQEKLLKFVRKLLKLFQAKTRGENNEQFSQTNQSQEADVVPGLFARVSSLRVNSAKFQIQSYMIDKVERQIESADFIDDEFTMKLIKKVFEMKIQVIQKRVLELQNIEKPLKIEHCNIKSRVYKYAASNFDNPSLKQDIKELPMIEYELTKKRFWPAWRKLTLFTNPNLMDIKQMLQVVWAKQVNILKVYVTLLLKYRQMQEKKRDSTELSEKEVFQLVHSTLEGQKCEIKSKEELSQDLRFSIRILSNFEEVKTLRNQRRLNEQKIKAIQQSQQYEKSTPTKVELCFGKWYQNKVFIAQIQKNGVPIKMKYTITPQPNQYERVLKKIEKLTKLNRNISLNLQKRSICLNVDQHQLQFQSYPKLVKYLLESYFQTVKFCQKILQLELYPLVWSRHVKIQPVKQKQNHFTLRFNPYEGILLQIFLETRELLATGLYHFPQFPFVQLSKQLVLITKNGKVYSQDQQSAEQYAFENLIQEMKAISLQQQDGNLEATYKNILKCPYFWSATKKFYELIQFKEKYHNNINIEESRRKQNQKVRASLSQQEKADLTAYLKQKEKKDKHPLYRSASSYNKTEQIYYSIEGLIQKQAFEEDIGNFRQKNARGELKPQTYKYHSYWWTKHATEIQYLIQLVAEREKKKGSNKSTLYQKTFNSFQNQIRNLRNLACHYIYDKQKKKEVTIQEKISIFQESFPKLFVFIYRWKPVIGKEYSAIQSQKIKLLCSLFPYKDKDNSEIINNLQQISQLKIYNIPNKKWSSDQTELLKKFNYERGRVKNCYPCSLITMFLYKRESFWEFLADAKCQTKKDGKIVFYNAFFWDHQEAGCNGMQFLQRAFYNTSQRNQFTVEELAQVEQAKIILIEEKLRLQRQIKRIENKEKPEKKQEKQQKQQKNVAAQFRKLTTLQKKQMHEEMELTDYVCKYFIFQLEMTFPYLFHDLRRFRYLWDSRAKAHTL